MRPGILFLGASTANRQLSVDISSRCDMSRWITTEPPHVVTVGSYPRSGIFFVCHSEVKHLVFYLFFLFHVSLCRLVYKVCVSWATAELKVIEQRENAPQMASSTRFTEGTLNASSDKYEAQESVRAVLADFHCTCCHTEYKSNCPLLTLYLFKLKCDSGPEIIIGIVNETLGIYSVSLSKWSNSSAAISSHIILCI